METIDLKELSKKSGKSELEIAKNIIRLLALKAEVTGKTQTVICSLKKAK